MKSFCIKQGTLHVSEKDQTNTTDYWRMVVPNEISVKQTILCELHCVLYVGILVLLGLYK